MNKINHENHNDRSDVAGEHKIGDIGQLILFILFLIVWIGDSFFLHYSTFLAERITIYVRVPIFIITFIAGAYIARTGLAVVFGKIREEPYVIRDGVFAVVRHPIYLSALLLYVSLFILTTSLISFALFILIFLFYHFISRHEEKLLVAKFGDEYEKYMADVPMWLPKFTRKR